MNKQSKTFAVGVTGASGSIYAQRLIYWLKQLEYTVELVVTEAGKKVSLYEKCGEVLKLADKVYAIDDYFAPMASGSHRIAGMVVLPCSMGTLGKIANGIGDNLLCRAADVQLKEGRPLIIVPREMPFSLIHLDNMKKLVQAGGVILPANPHFYHHPQSIDDIVDTVVARILDHLGVEHKVGKRWGELP
jgi:4-hydroxy-3-polyprenylbenzoate decarboxylase